MFRIEVTEIKEVETTPPREWVKLHDDDQADPEKKPQYGYRQDVGMRKYNIDTKVLSQTVEKLDLVAVIKAVNGIA